MSQVSQSVDLTNCDREPIHIPGSIQPHGVLIALDGSMVTVLRHSVNAAEIMGWVGDLNGRTIETLVGGQVTHDLRNALANAGNGTRAALIPEMPIGERHFDVAVHRFKGNVIVEFEPTSPNIEPPLQLARAMISRISRINNIDTLVQQAARQIRASLGYDRVMIYQFERDGAGKVVSEAKRADLESFLGQYFPASDIPQQARALYLKNTIRIISSSRYQAVPVEPVLDLSGEPLDLSFAHLRSVSPIHLEYLRNMGVGASMSISIVVDGELWGLIACHHYTPRTLNMPLRVAAEMFGEFFSLHLGALIQRRRLDNTSMARTKLDQMLKRSNEIDIESFLSDSMPDFLNLIPADGYGLMIDGKWTGQGATPAASDIPLLANFITSVADGKVWATHSLAAQFPEAERYYQVAAGMLAVPLSQLPRDYLLFFRKEIVQTLNWAGDPNKSYETGPLGDRLTPRKSFSIWKESVHRQSQPWTEQDREIAEAARVALVEIVLRHNELLAEERAKADVRQRMLNEELNHRVKNILAIIKSLVGQPVREGRSLADYVASLKGRIQALAVAHDQVIRGEGGGQIADLIEAEISPYRTPTVSITLQGPAIWLDARAFSVMALVLHELATNAAKYGALSRAGGNLAVTWDIDSTGSCVVDWRENGGPLVAPPSREGFGTYLLDRSVPFDLGGSSDVEFAPDGVRAHFCLPSKHVRRSTSAVITAAARVVAKPQAVGLPAETRILLLEDQMLIAMDIEASLADRGYSAVTTTNSAREALIVLERQRPEVAILDINLGETTSLPVAEALQRLGIPFIFATGYGEGTSIPEGFADVPIVRKPYDIAAVLAALAGVVGSSPS